LNRRDFFKALAACSIVATLKPGESLADIIAPSTRPIKGVYWMYRFAAQGVSHSHAVATITIGRKEVTNLLKFSVNRLGGYFSLGLPPGTELVCIDELPIVECTDKEIHWVMQLKDLDGNTELLGFNGEHYRVLLLKAKTPQISMDLEWQEA